MDTSSYSNIHSNSQSPTRYNRKVLERKLQAQTDWAELSRQQQAVIDQVAQQERERKMQIKNELSQTLNSMVNQKHTNRRTEELQNKQQDYYESLQRKQEYDEFVARQKNDKAQIQKVLQNEYNREQMQKDEERRKKIEQEKQTEQRMIYDALDSLQREKMIQDRKRNDFIQAADLQIREKEDRKRREQDRLQRERDEQNLLIAETKLKGEIQDMNRKMYYLKINEKQGNLQQVHDQRVRQQELSRDQQINQFIQKGVEEAKRKAEEEEIQLRMKKLELQKNMANSVRQKIYENEEQQSREKLAYREKVEKLMMENQIMQERNEQSQREKASQMISYKNILETQMRESEELSRKAHLEMPEHERRMQLDNFSGLVPGIKSTKADAYSPYGRNNRTINTTEPDMISPQSVSSPKLNSPYLAAKFNEGTSPSYRPYQNDTLRSNNTHSTNRGDINDSIRSPSNANSSKIELYNPITNPVPLNVQNPYLIKEFQRGNYNPKNVLAVTASNNLLGNGI